MLNGVDRERSFSKVTRGQEKRENSSSSSRVVVGISVHYPDLTK